MEYSISRYKYRIAFNATLINRIGTPTMKVYMVSPMRKYLYFSEHTDNAYEWLTKKSAEKNLARVRNYGYKNATIERVP